LYSVYIDWLTENNAREDVIHAVNGIMDYMNSADHESLIPEFKLQIQTIDNIRDEKFLEIYPELYNI
jgi:hypothetical protein